MSCQFKNECPSYSGWCEGPEDDFSRCIPFIINAVKGARQESAALRKQLDELQKRFDQINNFEQSQCSKLLVKIAERDKALARVTAEWDAAVRYIRTPVWCAGCRHFKGWYGCVIGKMEACTEENDLYEFGG